MAALYSCTKDIIKLPEKGGDSLCDTLSVSFTNDIQPFFQGSCAIYGCHDDASASSGYSFVSYNQIADSSTLVKAICSMKQEASCIAMPLGMDPVPSSKIDMIECWMNKGMPKSDLSLCDTLPSSFSGIVQPIFVSNCAVPYCHNSTSAAEGYVFETWTQISDSTTIELILCAIKQESTSDCSPMPLGQNPLALSDISAIECWIENGKPNN